MIIHKFGIEFRQRKLVAQWENRLTETWTLTHEVHLSLHKLNELPEFFMLLVHRMTGSQGHWPANI